LHRQEALGVTLTVQRTDKDFQEEFFDELVRQLKNYGGACREEFESKTKEFPLLGDALKKWA
jgi:hypothetical protein